MEYEDLPGYCKYFSNSKAILEGIFLNGKVRFTQPAALNDPIDCHPLLYVPCEQGQHTKYIVNGVLMPSVNDWYHIHLVESRVNEYGILSLTKNPISFDMWSKYANGHKGFLVEFRSDFNKDKAFCSASGHSYDVVPVTYVETFEISLLECTLQDGSLSLEEFEKRFFFSKVNRWSLEKEYRLIRPLIDIGKPPGGLHIGTYRDYDTIYLGDLPLDVINTITFGAYMPLEIKCWIVDQCRSTHIKFLQCVLYPKEKDTSGLSPAIRLLPLDEPSRLSQILEMQPQLLLMANEELLPSKQIQLDTIEELPYYNYKSDLVQMTFNRLRARKDKK
jgi:hypothetical protein